MSNTTKVIFDVWIDSQHANVLGTDQWRHVVELHGQNVVVWVRSSDGNIRIETQEALDTLAASQAVEAVLRNGPFKVGFSSVEVTL